ncbi:hypothetical protein RD792_001642 [Penstemon davidsonii]|uniref:Uncharacterized protein n=1 Tax=Penstemon davidsonii TaxID=160366 RepID=A0ABR0DNX7_9LAMI|nr:hypothetical protein RD792_001642 [Penstemon davidsonii]
MEQIETAPSAVPVVRHLDFTVNYNANVNGVGSLILPEHPQLESKFRALSQLDKLHARVRSPSPLPLGVETQFPPPKSPTSVTPQLAHPVKPKPALQPLMNKESPKSRERCNIEQKDGTPKKQKQCNCTKSKCLKL